MVEGRTIAGPRVRGACRRHLEDFSRTDIYWDDASVDRVLGFFEDICRLAGGQFEGKRFIPEPWQAFCAGSIFGWKKREDSRRRFRTAYIETAKGPLATDTPIPTPTGWTTMGELVAGDYVFDERGNPTEVIAVSPVFRDRECYRITWSDGSSIDADAEHRWPVSGLRSYGKAGPKPQNHPRKGGGAIRTTKELAWGYRVPPSSSVHPQAVYNYRSSIGGALQLPEADLPIPPYTLGAWLGDGDSDCARITCSYADSGVIERVMADGVPAERRSHYGNGRSARYVLGGDRRQAARNVSIAARLRALGLLNNKHIPSAYLRASETQRRQLLQGLLDTDGSALPGSQVELTLTNPRLAADARELIRSLGYKVTCTESAAKLNGREVSRRWRIRLIAYRDEAPVFCLDRKQQRLGHRPSTRALSGGRMIIGVEPIESVPVRCITVAADSHQFLAGEGMVPTCNSGKSPFAAAIGHYMLTADGEWRPEVYAAATKFDQAMVLFRDAVAMYQQSPDLLDRLIPTGGNFKTIWQLTYLARSGWFRAIASDGEVGKSGPRPSCALIDEIHEHKDESTIEMLEAGFKFRTNPLLLMITNSGSDLTSVCGKYHALAEKVCAGEVEDDEFFAYVCGLDDGEDPFENEACWIKANPSLGVTIKPEYLRSRIARARNLPDKRNEVLRLNFCVWTDAEAAWMTKDAWMAVQAPELKLEDFHGRRAWLGLDMAIRNDLNAAVGLIEDGMTEPQTREDGTTVPPLPKFIGFAKFYLPKEKLAAKEDQDGQPYRRWAEEGHLGLSEGNFVRQEFMASFLVDLSQILDLQAIAYDEYAVKWLLVELDRLGVKLPLIEHPQGFRRGKIDEAAVKEAKMKRKPPPAGLWMPASIGNAEELIIDKRVRFIPNPIMTWNIASATFEKDAQGNRVLSKRKATGKIDGAVGYVMASGAALNAPDQKPGSIYSRRGALVM